MGELVYILTGNRHGQVLIFENYDSAANWCRSATRWTEEEIADNIKTIEKSTGREFCSIFPLI